MTKGMMTMSKSENLERIEQILRDIRVSVRANDVAGVLASLHELRVETEAAIESVGDDDA